VPSARATGDCGRHTACACYIAAIGLLLVATTSCGRRDDPHALRVFHAAGFAPFLEQIRGDCQRDLDVVLQTEGSGSQEACRKVTELGRPCDLLVLADNQLVAALLGVACRWRIDFATDECVLGIGTRAPGVEKAEKDWPAAVLDDRVRLARVNENLAPIGYRTLLALKLQERLGCPGLCERFVGKCSQTVDDVERLPPLLRSGQADYAILYRSTCIAHGIRYVELDARVNLGSPDVDYTGVEVRFAKLKSGTQEMIAIRGSPIVWSMVRPPDDQRHDPAAFIHYILAKKAGDLDATGLRPLRRARFFGPADAYQRFRTVADHSGATP
jgi:molybdate/tungstate transport system substrate-binding protein